VTFSVSFYSWVLALHLLAAFALAASLVLFSVMVFAGRRMTTLEQTRTLFRLAPIGTALIIGGAALVLIFGVILALDSDQFNIWDPWVIAGIVLWAIVAGLGQRSGTYYSAIDKQAKSNDPGAEAAVIARLRASEGPLTHYAVVVVFLLLVLDMIFKPGA
jgi:uncharacterized membrane protein